MAGLKTSFSSQATFVLRIGSVKVPGPGCNTGFTLSTFSKLTSAQLVESVVVAVLSVVGLSFVELSGPWQLEREAAARRTTSVLREMVDGDCFLMNRVI